MELIYGAKNKREVQKLEKFCQLIDVIHLSEAISNKTIQLITLYAKSHNLDISDALIASTALVQRAKLFTYNIKDFKFVPDLELI